MACQMVYHNGNCLNTKKTFVRTCNLCVEICPHEAISEFRQLDAGRCTECGACMAVCPSDGFVDQSLDQLHDYLFSAEKELVLNCPQAVPQGFEISCLGMLNRDAWLVLLLLAERKPVSIITGKCGECPDCPACALSVRTFKRIHEDWADHAPIRILVRPDQGENPASDGIKTAESDSGKTTGSDNSKKPESNSGKKDGWGSGGRPLSRPGSSLRKAGWKLVTKWLPGLTETESYLLPKYRQWLLEALESNQENDQESSQENNQESRVPFLALTAQGICTGCGICETACPQGAVQLREEKETRQGMEEKESRQNVVEGKAEKAPGEKPAEVFRLILEPHKCVACGRCLELCRQEVLSLKPKFLNYRFLTGKVLLYEGSPKYCLKCGNRIYAREELCWICSSGTSGAAAFADRE